MAQRTDAKDCRFTLGWLASAVNMVGTPGSELGFLAMTSSTTASSSNLRCSTMRQPVMVPITRMVVMAKAWKNGSAPRVVSCPGMKSGNHARFWQPLM